MFEFSHFASSLQSIGAKPSKNTFALLDSYYSEDSRYYHDKSHVTECLSQFQKYRHLSSNAGEIETAFWFHDAIYDTKRDDNEEQSAQLAKEHLESLGAHPSSISNVVDMILATKTHEVTSEDSQIMLDIDLGILGTPATVFEVYDQKIRLEFHWVPIDLYAQGRKRVLQSFLDRELIYHTEIIRTQLEAQARENLARKIIEIDA